MLVPKKSAGFHGLSKQSRKRNLIWRKLKKVKDLMVWFNSCQKMSRLLETRRKIESELRNLYTRHNREAENRVIKEMKQNPNVFFSYAKARQKTKAKVGPLLDPSSGKLNCEPFISVNSTLVFLPNLDQSGIYLI